MVHVNFCRIIDTHIHWIQLINVKSKMRNSHNSHVFDAHYSSATKYYNVLLILLIAIPLLIGCFVSLNGSLYLTLFMFSLVLPIIALLIYLAVSTGNVRYELSSKELKIKILFYTKTISYTQIVSVEKAQLTILLKLFGAGLPGLCWGMFSTSIGNTHVYSTKRMGEYIVLTLADGKKIVLSPKDNDQFLNALNPQNPNIKNPANYIYEEQKQTSKKLIYTQVLIVTAAYCIFLGYFFTVYPSLPQVIPMQFDFSGAVSRWADKTELLWMAGIPVIFPIINAAIALKFGKYTRSLIILLGLIFIAVIAMFAFILQAIAATA